MKIKLLFLIICISLISMNTGFAQDTKSFTIVSVDKEVVWPAVFKAFQELKLPRPSIATQEGTGQTSYYNYKSLMIKNRLRFKLNYQADSLTISIFERQYYTKSGWTDNPLPMSKKQASKILDPLKTKIQDILNTIPTKVIIKKTKKVIVKHVKEEKPEELIAQQDPEKEVDTPKDPIDEKIKEKEKPKNVNPKPEAISETPELLNDNNYTVEVSNLNDKQTIIKLGHEAMEKINLIENKIKGLQSVANETNYLKIAAEIQNLNQSIEPIKKECIANINKIAKKRTILYTTKKTDPAKYYTIKSLKVYESHWEMRNINILVEVSYSRHRSTKTISDKYSDPKTFLEELKELRFKYYYNDEPLISNHTIPIFNKLNTSSFGISFENFERETKYVDFHSSAAKTTLLK